MRLTSRRIVAVATLSIAATGCQPWFERVPGAVPCTTTDRRAVTAEIGPAGGTLDGGYARITFDPGTFERPTTVSMLPHGRYHGVLVVLPTEDVSPPFTAAFPVDYCGQRPAGEQYSILTAQRREPARLGDDRVAQRRIAPGELTDNVREAGLFEPSSALVSGFVILSN